MSDPFSRSGVVFLSRAASSSASRRLSSAASRASAAARTFSLRSSASRTARSLASSSAALAATALVRSSSASRLSASLLARSRSTSSRAALIRSSRSSTRRRSRSSFAALASSLAAVALANSRLASSRSRWIAGSIAREDARSSGPDSPDGGPKSCLRRADNGESTRRSRSTSAPGGDPGVACPTPCGERGGGGPGVACGVACGVPMTLGGCAAATATDTSCSSSVFSRVLASSNSRCFSFSRARRSAMVSASCAS